MLINLIQKKTKLPLVSVQNTVALLKEGATIPFIARYRKERTGSLDENQIADIQKTYQSIQDLIKRKEYVLKVIEEQGNLTPKLKQQINNIWEYNTLEDLYLPYKRKATTKASVAIANGLEPLAKTIMQQSNTSLYKIAESYRNTKVKTVDNAIEGAKHIIAAWISESQYVRDRIRKQKKRIRNSGTDYLAFALLDIVIDNYIYVISVLGEKIESLEDYTISEASSDISFENVVGQDSLTRFDKRKKKKKRKFSKRI